jgi:hypothetical protein
MRFVVPLLFLCASLSAACAPPHITTPTRRSLDDIVAPASVHEEHRAALESLLAGSRETLFFAGSPAQSCSLDRDGSELVLTCSGASLRTTSLDTLLRLANDGLHFFEASRWIATHDDSLRDRIDLPKTEYDILVVSPEADVAIVSRPDGIKITINVIARGALQVRLESELGSESLSTPSFETLRPLLHDRLDSLRVAIGKRSRERFTLDALDRAVRQLSFDTPFAFAGVALGDDSARVLRVFPHPIQAPSVTWPAGDEESRRLRYASVRDPLDAPKKPSSSPQPQPPRDATPAAIESLELLDGKVVKIRSRAHFITGHFWPHERSEICPSLQREISKRASISIDAIALRNTSTGCALSLVRDDSAFSVFLNTETLEIYLTLEAELRERARMAERDKTTREAREHARICAICPTLHVGQTVGRYFSIVAVNRAACTMTIEAHSTGMALPQSRIKVGEISETDCDGRNEY